ncbi:MAG: response regulator [Gammaproteobacteria bacterium]|nr:response regulator [Gammaproteobacteria bacterium]
MEAINDESAAAAQAGVIVVCAESDRSAEYLRLLPDDAYEIRRYHRAREALDNPEFPDNAVIIVDETLSDMHGVDFVRKARAQGIKVPILMTVQKVSIPEAVEAIRLGADNILTKPLDRLKLEQAIKSALNEPGPMGSAARAQSSPNLRKF